ncbi:hypothetical protein [Streptomyces sp. NPDC048623]|uniref:hypothetical protein n=1 Tax=Streptomyces sp. NPDC048623 TaxID=3155761 RepID=UPI00342C466C
MLNPDRIEEIRDESQDELRTHSWADRVIDELLTDAETRIAVAKAVAAVTDSKGRNLAQRVASVQRASQPTAEQVEKATGLLQALLEASAKYGVTIDDWDWVADLPGACRDVMHHKMR